MGIRDAWTVLSAYAEGGALSGATDLDLATDRARARS